MIQTILVGIDGSTFSDNAISLGIRWARRTRAMLIGMGVVDEAMIRKVVRGGHHESPLRIQRAEDQVAAARHRTTQLLDRFAKRCESEQISCRVLQKTGQPAETIAAETEDMDLTVLGQRTFFRFDKPLEADGAGETVLRNCHRPVVVVPETLAVNQNVVVAYDASPGSVRALEAFQKANLEDWKSVTVVSVSADSAVASRHAEEATKFLRFFEIPAEAQPLAPDRPTAEMLLEQVRVRDAAFLVLGAFGRSPHLESVLGSTTETILEKSEVPLFCHH